MVKHSTRHRLKDDFRINATSFNCAVTSYHGCIYFYKPLNTKSAKDRYKLIGNRNREMSFYLNQAYFLINILYHLPDELG